MSRRSPVSAGHSWSFLRSKRLGQGLVSVSVLALAAGLGIVAAPAASASSAKAKLSISPGSHNYGTTVLGSDSASQSFAVTNTGTVASGALAVAVTGTDAADFVIDADSCTPAGTLAAGSACSVSVHFAPSAVGTRKASLSVSGAPGGTVTATLEGTGGAANLVLSPSSHQFGTVTVGASSGAQSFTVTNTGAGPSGPVSVAVGGTNAGDFVENTTTCGAGLAAGSSCTVGVLFTPAAEGALSATLSATATPGGTVSSSLHGTGAAKALLSVSPSTFDYGPVVDGSSSASETYTVTNTGLATSGMVSVAIGGTDAADFVQDATTCGAKLAVGASCTVTVDFAPTAGGAGGTDDASLSVTANPGGTATASLQGTGTTPAALAISPSTFDYGSVAAGAVSGDQTYTVTNTGQGSSGPVSLALSGTNQADFVVDSTTCGAALAGAGSCTVSVHYAPAGTGAGTATLSVTSSPGGTASASLQGTGITPASLSMDPTVFDFGATPVGASSSDQSFTVTNVGQATSGPIAVATNGTNAADFVVDSTTCGAGLAGGDSCSISVHFTAGASGTLAGGLSATATPGGTATAALQGEGLEAATLAISPTPFDFGQTPIGDTSTAYSFVVTNVGQTTSGTVGVSLGGTSASDFTVKSSTCGVALDAGDTCTVVLTFDSYYTGTYTASLTATAAPGGSATASLQAEAIVPAYFNNNSTIDFNSVLVGSSSGTQTVLLTNFGQQTSGVVHVALGGADAGDFAIDSNTCTGVLVGGASCSVTLHFSPTALGARTATLTESANPGGIQTNTLQGTGVNVLTVSPTSYTFPNQDVGTTSAATSFLVTNYGATPLTSFSITASDPTDLPITADTCVNATLNTGASCTVSVAFDAAVLGQHSSTMNVSMVDGSETTQSATFQASGTSIVPPPDLATSMSVLSEDYTDASVQISVTNLGAAVSAPATMTIDADPIQDFSYEAGAGTDCTASFVNIYDAVLTCPVPAIAAGATYTRLLTEENLTGQAPMYIQNTATTIMPGDTNSSNNTGYAFVTFS